MVIRKIPEHIIKYIADRQLYVLRRKKDGVPLNVSYSPYGLHWTSNKLGRALLYKRAFISGGKIRGDLTPDPALYIEMFVPRDHPTEVGQVAEYTWITKALKLCY